MLDLNLDVAKALADGLLRWYAGAARPLPWRNTRDPYAIFLSEIILQQTRVAQGLPYYERFIEAYPTVGALAEAPDDDVMRLWQGLGYYSRARNMLKAGRQVAITGWPQTAAGLVKLPGVGPYTAAAIASFAFGEAVPVLDGNVARVLSRWLDCDQDILKPATQAFMREAGALLMKGQDPATFNQAMMEFGALQCTPGLPPCLACPVRDLCLAFERRTVPLRPVKAKAAAKRERQFLYLVIRDGTGNFLVRQRTDKDIWKGLYEFVLLEGQGQMPSLEEGQREVQALVHGPARMAPTLLWSGKHVLTHQTICIEARAAWVDSIKPVIELPYRWVSAEAWEALGKPVPMLHITKAHLDG